MSGRLLNTCRVIDLHNNHEGQTVACLGFSHKEAQACYTVNSKDKLRNQAAWFLSPFLILLIYHLILNTHCRIPLADEHNYVLFLISYLLGITTYWVVVNERSSEHLLPTP